MTVGQVVDFVVDFNERNERAEQPKEEKPKMRMMTQSEIDAFLG